MAGKKTCAACNQIIQDRRYLTCTLCPEAYDIECVNVSEARFYNTMTVEHKRKWICPQCKSKEPKKGNTNTPVRLQLAVPTVDNCLSESTNKLSPKIDVDNVTRRKKTILNYADDTSLYIDNTLPEGDTINLTEESSHILLMELRALRSQFDTHSQKQEVRDSELKNTINELQKSINCINDKYMMLETEFKVVTASIEQNNTKIKELERENKQLRQELTQTKELVSIIVHTPGQNTSSNSLSSLNMVNNQEEMHDKQNMAGGSLGKSETRKSLTNRSVNNENNSKILVLYGLDELWYETEAELHDRVIDVFQSITQVDLTGYIEDLARIGQRGSRRPLKVELLSKRMTKYLLTHVTLFKNTGLWISEILDQKGLQDRKERRDIRRKTRQYINNNDKKIFSAPDHDYPRTNITEHMNGVRNKNHSFRQQ